MFEMLGCAIDTDIPKEQMAAIVSVESKYRQFAIGVVGGYLNRQPINIDEAVATVKYLEENGKNYSVGLAQINKTNFAKYGLNTANMFDACKNLQAGSQILRACYLQYRDWNKAYSCYYSGNPVTGFAHGYVRKVINAYGGSVPVSVLPSKISTKPIKFIAYSSTKNSRISSAPKRAISLLDRRLAAAKPSSMNSKNLINRRLM